MTEDDGRCPCWSQGAYPHAGHCCFADRDGETHEQAEDRWNRHDRGEEPLCHGEYVGGPPNSPGQGDRR